MPATWDVLTIFTHLPRQPHDKHCICVDPRRREVFFINSEPPFARKARQFAITIANFECAALSKAESYVDTTDVIVIPEEEWNATLRDANRNRGPLLPGVVERIRTAIRRHTQLTANQRQILGV